MTRDFKTSAALSIGRALRDHIPVLDEPTPRMNELLAKLESLKPNKEVSP